MARVRDVTPGEVAEELRDTYERYANGYASFRNQVGVFAHVPTSVKHLMGMLLELREQKNLPYRLVELAVLAVSKLNQCDYCVGHHKPLLVVEGISPEGADTILDYKTHPELNEVDKLVVEYAVAVTNAPQKIRDNVFERLRAHFSEAQIVELTLRISLCGFFNRFNDALQVEDEPSALAEASAGG